MSFVATPTSPSPEPLRRSLRLLQRYSPSPARPILRSSLPVTEHTACCTTATCHYLFHEMIMQDNSDSDSAQAGIRSRCQELFQEIEQFSERLRELGSMINQPRAKRSSLASLNRRMDTLRNEMRILFRRRSCIMKEWHDLAK